MRPFAAFGLLAALGVAACTGRIAVDGPEGVSKALTECPDLVLMDMSLPGIDGWETIRRLRLLAPGRAQAVAIVSANAFDKGLENDVGIPGEDFILKPVRHSELLDWLTLRLSLVWTDNARPATHRAPGYQSPRHAAP